MSQPALVPCASCRRHIQRGAPCPFCGAAGVGPPPGGFGLDEGASSPVPKILDDEIPVPAPHYGMPPTSPANPVFWVFLLALIGGGVFAYLSLR